MFRVSRKLWMMRKIMYMIGFKGKYKKQMLILMKV
jgi:hypothetical protein